ncbi:FecR family protein [Chitinophaga sp. Hz27]|uniref:FecR family protein n=1 Tax=Chitinophaga sp. Hz27 TaxID=3347169 RepID=UPI0035DF6BD2
MNNRTMPEAKWKYIVEKYLSNTCTREELHELLQWVEEDPDNEHLIAQLRIYWEANSSVSVQDDTARWEQRFNEILEEEASPPPPRIVRYRPWLAAAAAVLLLVTITTGYLKLRHHSSIHVTPAAVANDVAPGGNRAMLTLADGSVISLDSAANGLLAQQGNTSIRKQQNGELTYNGTGTNAAETFNTITIPKAGKYALELTDGTKVWLNAASTLRFPLAFGKERHVILTGEAYFEIAPDVNRPFVVSVANTEVHVLGTSFNIMAYQEEGCMKTTLVTGSLAVKSNGKQVVLHPGQQANIFASQSDIQLQEADLEEVLAWKNDRFYFNNTDIHTAMRQLERWYDVNVTFKDSLNMSLNGTVSRTVNISGVLKLLTLTGEANFTIDGKSVTVGK